MSNPYENIPIELKAVRLGTPVNLLSGKLIINNRSMVAEKLGISVVQKTAGMNKKSFIGNASASASASDIFYSMSHKAKQKFLFASASASFSMSKDKQKSDAYSSVHSLITNSIVNVSLSITQTEEELWRYMTDSFKAIYNKIMNAKDEEEMQLNYEAFTKQFGHACVTTLHLGCQSIAEISFSTAERSNASQSQYGGSLAVGWGSGGFSSAGNYAKDIAHAYAGASMSTNVVNIPENAPTGEWVENLANNFDGKAVEELLKTGDKAKSLIPEFETHKMAEAPEIPEHANSEEGPKKDEPKKDTNSLTDTNEEDVMPDEGAETELTNMNDITEVSEIIEANPELLEL